MKLPINLPGHRQTCEDRRSLLRNVLVKKGDTMQQET